jgi:alpha-mannosidase
MFFLRQYWEHCAEQRETVRELVNEGRLRLTSSGVTTADTLLPSTEAILRDLLIGQEWLRINGTNRQLYDDLKNSLVKNYHSKLVAHYPRS